MNPSIRNGIIAFAATAAILIITQPASSQGMRERIRERVAQRVSERMQQSIREDMVSGGESHSYGADALQTLAFWRPQSAPNVRRGPAPLIIFVHGGGWKRGSLENATGKAKVEHFTAQGYAFASINYRLVPDATVEQQAADVASALAYLKAHAGELGVDPARIVLMGHSAGAHLIALVGTDPRYFTAAGLGMNDVRGIIPLDGAAYDVPSQMGENARLLGETYAQAFGTDPARQQALSPTRHAAGPNAPAFLLMYVQRADGIRQAEGLAKALKASGTAVAG
jgi:arylformamidase